MATTEPSTNPENTKAPQQQFEDLPHQIEHLMAALPSTTWLTLAGVSLIGSLGLKLLGRQHLSLFVGQLAPTLLIAGLYNKLTKVGAASALLSSRR